MTDSTNFYVPAEVLNILFKKEIFSHRLAIRIFLYIKFFKSGRINTTADLVLFFDSSTQSVQKCLDWLTDNKFVVNSEKHKEWYTALGKEAFRKQFAPTVTHSNSYAFCLEDLKNVKVFNSKIFKYCAENLSISYGDTQIKSEVSSVSLAQRAALVDSISAVKDLSSITCKKNDNIVAIDADDEGGVTSITEKSSKVYGQCAIMPLPINKTTIRISTQVQSQSYLAASLNRSKISIKKHLQNTRQYASTHFVSVKGKSIPSVNFIAGSHDSDTLEIKSEYRRVKCGSKCRLAFKDAIISDFHNINSLRYLTDLGFGHEDNIHFGTMQGGGTKEEAQTLLQWWKTGSAWHQEQVKDCFVKRVNNCYLIVTYRASTNAFTGLVKTDKAFRQTHNKKSATAIVEGKSASDEASSVERSASFDNEMISALLEENKINDLITNNYLIDNIVFPTASTRP